MLQKENVVSLLLDQQLAYLHMKLKTFAVDHETGEVIHHDMKQGVLNVPDVQTDFINLIQQMGCLPSTIITNYKTGLLIGPVVDRLRIHVEISTELPRMRENKRDVKRCIGKG